MDNNPQTNKPVDLNNLSSPTAMLAAQTQSLADLVAIQQAQSVQIEELKKQNERLIGITVDTKREKSLSQVKIENINMPFWAMVGFLIKLSLASIPAMIILTVIFGILTLVLGGIFGVFLGPFSDLLR